MVVGVMGAGGIAFGFVPGVRGWFASRPHATVQSDVQARERRPLGSPPGGARHSPPQAGGREGPRVRGWFASRRHATVQSDAQARERRPLGSPPGGARHSPPQAGGREGPRVQGWFASRRHATVQSDAQARERRPPGRHSPPQAGGREGPRVRGWFASRQGPRRSASSGRLRGTRLSLRCAQRCRPGGRRSLLCRRNRTPEHALTRRRGCPAPPNRMRPAPPKPPPPPPPGARYNPSRPPGRGSVWQSTWFGIRGSQVQILPPRRGSSPRTGSGPDAARPHGRVPAPTRLVPTDGFRPRRGSSPRTGSGPDAARPHGRVPAPTRPRRPAVSDAFSPPFSTQESGCHFGTHPWFKTCIFRRSCRRRFVSAGALFLALAP